MVENRPTFDGAKAPGTDAEALRAEDVPRINLFLPATCHYHYHLPWVLMYYNKDPRTVRSRQWKEPLTGRVFLN